MIELLLAATLWGFGFIATVWALARVDAFEITLLRFGIAGLVGLPFFLKARGRLRLFRLSWISGVLLTSTLVFQTWGLQYTTATKSGFITTLYVVMVPLLEAVLMRRRIHPLIWLCVVTALVGTALIVDIGFSDVNRGDLMTLFCAVLATGQIYWMGRVSPLIDQPFSFNIGQCYWSFLFTLPLVSLGPLRDKLLQVTEWPLTAVIGVLSLALGSTVIAFYLQVRAQAKMSPTVSSLMFLLESPFAMLFAMIFLHQSLNALEAVGAFLIFVSAFTATWVEAQARIKKD